MENVLPATSTNDTDDGLKVLAQGFAMIVASEIGDKTFLIAAILAMRHPRNVVFAGAFGALAAMSFLSAALGHVFPSLIPKSYTQFVASVLFFVFGAKMLQEGRAMPSGAGKIQEEMREAEEEIEEDDAKADGTGVRALDGHAVALEELERGEADMGPEEMDLGDGEVLKGRGRSNSNGDAVRKHRARSTSRSRKSSTTSVAEGARNFFSLLLGPVFVQAFALTFLGEWGDRSQIATIALGAAHNMYIVAFGTTVGHACCTALAVIGGRYVSTKISVKHVTLGGAILFLLFGFIYLYEAFRENSEHVFIASTSHEEASDLLHR